MSTFKNNKQQRINAAAAPDALKVSGLANCVRAALAPDSYRVNAVDRLLMDSASVADNKNCFTLLNEPLDGRFPLIRGEYTCTPIFFIQRCSFNLIIFMCTG